VLELEITLFSMKNACKEWPIGFIWPIEILRKGPWAHLVKIFPYHCRFYYFLLSVNLKTGLIRGVIFEGGGPYNRGTTVLPFLKFFFPVDNERHWHDNYCSMYFVHIK
jgi:hypothetical protein